MAEAISQGGEALEEKRAKFFEQVDCWIDSNGPARNLPTVDYKDPDQVVWANELADVASVANVGQSLALETWATNAMNDADDFNNGRPVAFRGLTFH